MRVCFFFFTFSVFSKTAAHLSMVSPCSDTRHKAE